MSGWLVLLLCLAAAAAGAGAIAAWIFGRLLKNFWR